MPKEIIYENITINSEDFTDKDLQNNTFSNVRFERCNFVSTTVVLQISMIAHL